MIKRLAALMILWGAGQAEATTLPYKSLDNLVQEADAVVSGIVSKIESKRFDEEIHTYVLLDGVETLHGNYQGTQLTIIHDGGFADGEGIHIVGTPTFQEGEKVVMFVDGNGTQKVPFVGWEQGVFKVARDARSGSEQMLDTYGNKVLSISPRGKIEKEELYKGEAEIFVTQEQSEYLSQDQQTSGGETDLGERAATAAKSSLRSGVRFDQFLKEVKARGRTLAPSRSLRSVKVGDKFRRAEALDAVMAGEKKGSATVDSKPVLPSLSDATEAK